MERPKRLKLDHIDPSPRNPRRRLDEVEDLAQSIQTYGLLQPIVVRPLESGRYEVVAGHRRLAAARSLEWSDIPCFVRQADDEQAYLLTLIENLQREDLSPREQASALEQLVRERGWSTRQVAEAVKKSAAYVSRRLRVFEDPVLAPLVLERRLPVSFAEELLTLPPAKRRQLAQRAADEAWERPQFRAALQRAAGKNQGRRRTALVSQLRETRRMLQEVQPWSLSEQERREMRLMFSALSMLARAPAHQQAVVVPELPQVSARRRAR